MVMKLMHLGWKTRLLWAFLLPPLLYNNTTWIDEETSWRGLELVLLNEWSTKRTSCTHCIWPDVTEQNYNAKPQHS
ncbi:hypothetical protein GGS24DRAFT_486026 [Hypoxylon argillaceum]|nr:hypothetical protein GGS24DRAFT_486026 [Hypoxylon argillaceum]